MTLISKVDKAGTRKENYLPTSLIKIGAKFSTNYCKNKYDYT